MISLPDREALLAALEMPLAPVLNSLLSETVARAEVSGLLDLTYLLIVERDDDGDAIADEIGFSPFADPTEVAWQNWTAG
ncbi:MAG: hypothetical protein EOP17_01230 [Rhizobiaceae bacterium]|nr:MAG: hypothetical protein EOP17_01230 [Rhizobiaceae bacterium]